VTASKGKESSFRLITFQLREQLSFRNEHEPPASFYVIWFVIEGNDWEEEEPSKPLGAANAQMIPAVSPKSCRVRKRKFAAIQVIKLR
jgi:hypothetical protein